MDESTQADGENKEDSMEGELCTRGEHHLRLIAMG